MLLTVSGSNNLRRKGGDASSTAGAAASGSSSQRNKRIQGTRDNTLILNAQTSEQGPRIPAMSATSNRLPYIRLQFKQRKEKYTTYGWKISYCHDNLWISRQKEGAKWVEIIRAFSATNQSQREEWCVRCARRHWEIFLLENIQRNHSLLDWRWK